MKTINPNPQENITQPLTEKVITPNRENFKPLPAPEKIENIVTLAEKQKPEGIITFTSPQKLPVEKQMEQKEKQPEKSETPLQPMRIKPIHSKNLINLRDHDQ